VRQDVNWFAKHMEAILDEKGKERENRGAPLYPELQPLDLARLCAEKMKELSEEVISATTKPSIAGMKKISRLATHVGNYAMMIAVVAEDQKRRIKAKENA
jgi:hypothetical protein